MLSISGYTKAVQSELEPEHPQSTIVKTASSFLMKSPSAFDNRRPVRFAHEVRKAAYSPSSVYRIAVPLKVIFSQPIAELTVVA